jgi:hypothetical protein
MITTHADASDLLAESGQKMAIRIARGRGGLLPSVLAGAAPRAVASTVSAPSIAATDDGVHEYPFTAEHRALQRSYTKLIEKEINPFVDEWEAKGRFPAHEVFKKLGTNGFLGLCKPVSAPSRALPDPPSLPRGSNL